MVARAAPNRPHGRSVYRLAGGRQKPWRAASRFQESLFPAWDFTAPRTCSRLAVLLYAAAGLAEGQPADCLAPGPYAAGVARAVTEAGQENQPAAYRARPRHDEGQPERQTLWPTRPERPYR